MIMSRSKTDLRFIEMSNIELLEETFHIIERNSFYASHHGKISNSALKLENKLKAECIRRFAPGELLNIGGI